MDICSNLYHWEKIVTQRTPLQIDVSLDKIQLFFQRNTQLLGQFQISPHQLDQRGQFLLLLLLATQHLLVQHIKNKVGRQAITDILQTQRRNHTTAFCLHQRTLLFTIQIKEKSDKESDYRNATHNQMGLPEFQHLILCLAYHDTMSQKCRVLLVAQGQVGRMHPYALITNRVIQPQIILLIIIGLPVIACFFIVLLQILIADMHHVRVNIGRRHSM